MTQAQFETQLMDALNREGFARMGTEDALVLNRRDIQELLDTISEQLGKGLRSRTGGGVVPVRGLGRYRITKRAARKARMGRNPATGEALKIAAKPASKALKVTGDRHLREALKVA